MAPTATATSKAADRKATRPRKTITEDHKRAIAVGRIQNKAVNDYLLAACAPQKRGRKRTRESILLRLAAIDDRLAIAEPLHRLQLLQEELDLQAELEAMDEQPDLAPLEAAFIEHAAAYGRRRGISYATWRKVGVPAAMLKRAGIHRG